MNNNNFKVNEDKIQNELQGIKGNTTQKPKTEQTTKTDKRIKEDKKKIISITITESIINRLDNHIKEKYKQTQKIFYKNRSEFIEYLIKKELGLIDNT